VQIPGTTPAAPSSPATSTIIALVLVNLHDGESYLFNFFPEKIELTGRANWKAQEVVRRTKPLFYANREPQSLSFPSVWLDNTANGESLTPELVQLLALQEVTKGQGTPPPLLARWGDSSFRCVLEDVQIVQQYFTKEGNPLRAELSLTLLELQDEPAAPVERKNEEANILF
jgi:phage protein U